MTRNEFKLLSLSSILSCSAYYWLLPYFSPLYFLPLAGCSSARSCCLTLSFFLSGPLSLLQCLNFFVRHPLHSQMDALSALAAQICLSVRPFVHKMRLFFFFPSQCVISNFQYMYHPAWPISVLYPSHFL